MKIGRRPLAFYILKNLKLFDKKNVTGLDLHLKYTFGITQACCLGSKPMTLKSMLE